MFELKHKKSFSWNETLLQCCCVKRNIEFTDDDDDDESKNLRTRLQIIKRKHGFINRTRYLICANRIKKPAAVTPMVCARGVGYS
jgi:hypothetical protein